MHTIDETAATTIEVEGVTGFLWNLECSDPDECTLDHHSGVYSGGVLRATGKTAEEATAKFIEVMS